MYRIVHSSFYSQSISYLLHSKFFLFIFVYNMIVVNLDPEQQKILSQFYFFECISVRQLITHKMIFYVYRTYFPILNIEFPFGY